MTKKTPLDKKIEFWKKKVAVYDLTREYWMFREKEFDKLKKDVRASIQNILERIEDWMKDFEWDNRSYNITKNEEDKDYLATCLYKRDFEELKEIIKSEVGTLADKEEELK